MKKLIFVLLFLSFVIYSQSIKITVSECKTTYCLKIENIMTSEEVTIKILRYGHTVMAGFPDKSKKIIHVYIPFDVGEGRFQIIIYERNSKKVLISQIIELKKTN